MSPLWRSRINLVISPDRINLNKVGRGWTPKLLASHVVVKESSSWQPVLENLSQILAQPEWQNADVHVVLSDRAARYAVFPPNAKLQNYALLEAYARHQLGQIYGSVAEQWELRIQVNKTNSTCLVSAVDKGLLDGLRQACVANKLKFCSVTPHLMQVFNRYRKTIKADPVWLVLSEPDHSLIALMKGGEIVSVNGVRHDGMDELGMLLDRENLISPMDEPCKSVLVYAPQNSRLPTNTLGYEFKRLETGSQDESATHVEGLFAMAMNRSFRGTLELNFQKPAEKQSSIAGWLLLLTGLALLIEMGISYDHLQNDRSAMDREIQTSKLQLGSSSEKPASRQFTDKDFEEAKQIMVRLAAPWDAFFTGLGSVNNKNVAILSVVPDMKSGVLQIEGEAKDYAAALTLVAQLRTTKPFKEVFLMRHEVKQNDPQHPISFAVSMRWVQSS